jgi:TRAP transporter TAXI family solute receptor
MQIRLSAVALLASIAVAATAAHAQTVGIATSPAGSLYHTQASAIAPMLKEKGNIELRVQPFTSPEIHLPAINAGQIEFGLANIYDVYLAVGGLEFFKGKKNDNLRIVTITAPLRSAIFVKKDSPAKQLADLKGQRVTWGYVQQNTIKQQLLSYFDAAGLQEKDIVPVLVPAVVRGADDFAAGKADAFLFAVGSAKVTEVDASVGGVRALPIPQGPQTEAAFKKNFPPAYVSVVNPAPGMAGIAEPTPIMTYDAVMVTHASAPEELVYNMTRTLHENAAAVDKSSPTLRGFSANTMAKKIDLAQYHPGAIKYYKEKGLWPK